METAPQRAEWLGWDGTRLRWHLPAQAAAQSALLLLDGVVYERFAAGDAAARDFVCEFPYSPSGQQELCFSLVDADVMQEILPVWRVRHGELAQVGIDAWTQAPRAMAPLSGAPMLPSRTLAESPPVAVVVPIYNSPQHVKRCIASVLRWSPRAQLILVDDASTDAQIGEILAAHRTRENVIVQRNARNRGFTHSVNVGVALAGGADVVLLNSDTEVGPRWLAALRIAAYGADDIGTVTAVSDNAGAFTVPALEPHCPIPSRWTLVQGQRALLQQAGLRYPQLPTGNGFCMYIKRVLIARIGPMDEAAFPQGYGEENDFCQRAERAGYRHLIAGNVLVHHDRSASFGGARRIALGAQGMTVLRERYPDYEAKVGATLHSFARRTLDYRVRRVYADGDGLYAQHPPRPRLLVAADAGDTDAERLLTTLANQYEGFLLRREGGWVNLYRHADVLLHFERGVAIGDTAKTLGEIETRLREWLVEYAIESVHARGNAASDGWLAGLANGLDIPTMHTRKT